MNSDPSKILINTICNNTFFTFKLLIWLWKIFTLFYYVLFIYPAIKKIIVSFPINI